MTTAEIEHLRDVTKMIADNSDNHYLAVSKLCDELLRERSRSARFIREAREWRNRFRFREGFPLEESLPETFNRETSND